MKDEITYLPNSKEGKITELEKILATYPNHVFETQKIKKQIDKVIRECK